MSRPEPTPVEVAYDAILKVLDQAILFRIDAHKDGKVWLPKSQIEEVQDAEPDDEGLPLDGGTFTIPEWLAIERGLV